MKKIIVQGFKKEVFSAEEIQVTKDSNLQLKQAYIFSSSRAGAEKHEVEINDADVLEFVFDDSTTWMGDKSMIYDLFPAIADQKRGVNDAVALPMYLNTEESNRSLIGDIALKALHIFTKNAVVSKVKDIATSIEKKVLENMSGVYQVTPVFKLEKTVVKESEKPYLLFIHGTNSSTAGSFAEILGSELWRNMQQTYGNNILALQHETLTKSPLQNVIDLVKALPTGAKLHLISHSRGGLVGDVMARYCNGNKGFTEQEIEYLDKTDRKSDIENIRTLQSIAPEKNIVIEKFIRVACPAFGTTILSKRLDYFLNISLNLMGALFGPAASFVIGEFKSLISAAVDTKNDPNDLPGLEAMNPDSAFLKVLNNPLTTIESPLTVISGNCGIKFNLKALLIIASKLFYTRDNDLVVDTKSMYCGTRRNIKLQYFFDEGAEVDHVHYFKNKKTQDALLIALTTSAEALPGFASYEQALQAALDRNALLGLDGGGVFSDEVKGVKPIAIVLPGIMGSNLKTKKNLVWINYFRFLVGELTRLDISEKNVEPTSLIKTSYKKMVDYLAKEYDVVTFAFDWRQPLAEAAAKLNAKIEEYLALNVPIKIIGHSMGGVVTRDFIVNHPATWKKLNASKGFKLLYLGAPLGGSYRIPYVLAGKDSIINQLSKIDLSHTKRELLDMFRKFPGLLGLMPLSKEPHDFAKTATWKQMKDASLFDWLIPDEKDLTFFGAYRDNVLKHKDDIEYENIYYIAGKDESTVSNFEINDNLPNEKINFISTSEGDQSVTWETGIPAKLIGTDRLYYVNVSHGGLANNVDMFQGISEILNNGKTDLMNRNRPVSRGAKTTFKTLEKDIYNTDEASVINTLLGLEEKTISAATSKVPLQVSVSNGHLFYSQFPVMVGHFKNDGITSAEKVIDNLLDNQLSIRHKLVEYPGEIGSNNVFINTGTAFKGAIVIGLGKPGRLSSYQLAQTTELATINYILELQKICPVPANAPRPENGITLLLIGAGYGGLGIESSIRSLLQGIQAANAKVEALNRADLKPIEKVEFVELYEDLCLQCLYILSKAEAETDSTLNIRLTKKRIKKLIGAKTRIPLENSSDWWSRISVEMHKEKIKGIDDINSFLRFKCSTGSAREEQRDLQTSPEILNEIVEELSTDNNWDMGLAKTFFELMIPNDFKDEVKKQSNTLWVLDSESAAYPWELLQDSIKNARPLCCNAGMIRQLELDDYRIKVDSVPDKTALVIGDPDLKGYPYAQQLPGAFKEANMVAAILEDYGYNMPNNCFKKSSGQIINALFKDDYKIIHLAGHGVFNEKNPKASGMLIGNNVFLSTREICQMSKVPELVFVNCCFLGKMDADAEVLYRSRYKLAANIGTQLIMNGVKVVIAAGWAVDDAAALYFTENFYNTLLGGANFGDSVKEARLKTFNKFPTNNTWGAYQCYGDPFFRITETRSLSGESYKYLIAQEAENDLNNLLNQADAIGYTSETLRKKLKLITDAVEKAGISNAPIIEKEALVLTECSEYELAIDKFKELVAMEQAGYSVKALEKYCNIRAKLCVKNWVNDVDKKGQVTEMNKVIKALEQLLNLSNTAERLSLLGSAYKRKSIITPKLTEKIKALIAAAGYYKEAYELPSNTNKNYALTNWLEIEKILELVKNRKEIKEVIKAHPFIETDTFAAAITDLIDKKPDNAADIDFWTEVGYANAALCLWLLENGKGKKVTDDFVVGAYTAIWKRAGSLNKKIAEMEHFDFLLAAYSDIVKSADTESLIKKIRSDLNTMV
jgi:CHAT domain/Lecithin:cholesterol acyltransferase